MKDAIMIIIMKNCNDANIVSRSKLTTFVFLLVKQANVQKEMDIYIITNNKRNRQNHLSACWLEIFYKMYRCSLTKKDLGGTLHLKQIVFVNFFFLLSSWCLQTIPVEIASLVWNSASTAGSRWT